MSPERTYPGVYVEEANVSTRSISDAPSSIALFIGWAPRGRADAAVRIASFTDYQRGFGGLDTRTWLGHAVKQFFDNGGSDAYIVRLIGPGCVPSSAILAPLAITASSPGLWGDGYRVRITQLAAPDNTHFNLDVLDKSNNDAVVESFGKLSTDAGDPHYAPSAINGQSAYITVDVSGAGTPANATVDLGGGADGAVLSPGQSAFHSALGNAFGPGSMTDRIDIFNLVCVPGETDATALGTLQQHCCARRAFLIADGDNTQTVGDLANGLPVELTGDSASNAAIFFPWVRAPDPLKQAALTDFPPCGFVAGVFARTDGAHGIWKAPSGSNASLNGAAGLTVSINEAENGQLNPLGINCLRTLPAFGSVVWGARTMAGQDGRNSEWKYIPVRRMALYLEESICRGVQWAVFEPNDEALWTQIRLDIGTFMQGLFRQGAFSGQTPRDAYFVRCGSETTTQADIAQGIVNIVVGFAPLKPAEFVVITLQQLAAAPTA